MRKQKISYIVKFLLSVMTCIFFGAVGSSWAESKPLDADGAERLHNAKARIHNPSGGQQIGGLLENDSPMRCMGYGDLQSISLTDWETGLGLWTAGTHDVANPDTFDTPDWATVAGLPDARAGMAAFVANLSTQECETDDETGALTLDSPAILIPDGTEVPRISIDHWFDVEFRFDGGNFKISVNGSGFNLIPASAIEVRPYNFTLYPALDSEGDELNTNPLADQDAFTGPDAGGANGSWGQSHINLLGIASAGDTIRLRFDFGVDVCFGVIGWYVDEVEFYSCSAELPPSDCGNGVIDAGEQCDDGNDFSGDGCSNACQIEDGWQCTSPLPPGDISDPSFEDGTPNPSWAESSTNFDTPICDVATCDTGEGTGPLDGNYWAWFGGATEQEEASVSQSVSIPSTATELTFGLEVNACDSPADYLEVLIDDTRELLIDGSSPLCGVIGYSTQTVDISAYADGGAHDLEFHAETFANNADVTNIFIDVIAIPGVVSVCTPDTHTVTSSVGTPAGNISPLGGQSIDHGNTTQFTLTPDPNYHIASVGGSCGGSLVSNTYTTSAITGDCTVVANFTIDTHTVTSSVGTPAGNISPLGGQSVDDGDTTQFTLTPDPNYHIDSVGGTCGGSLVSNTYTTSAITADCTVVANFAIDTHTVTSSVGTPAGNISPLGGQSVDHGDTTQFTLTPDPNYHIGSVSGTCGGSLVSNTYTTSAITADCTVIANFAIDTHTVTSSVGTAAGNISPLGGQSVDHGDTTQFTLTPDPNYHIASVGGSCGGSLVSNTYTTSAITADCTVVANFVIDTHTVTSSVGTPAGSITPLGAQQIDRGSTTQFTLTPNTGYHIDSVGGTCGGSLVSNTYTTSAITADCTVVANFAIDIHTVTSSVGTAAGSISPLGGQSVDSGTTTQFTLTPAPNYHIASVGGTCGGSLVSNTYTTSTISGDCTVVANFAIDTHTVTSSVGTPAGGISPLGGQQIDHGSTTQFTLTPNTGYHIDSVGGTCGGSLVSNTYTTSAITADCTVVANFVIDTHTVTSSVGTPAGSISPLGGQSIDYGDTTQFTLTPDPNYHIASVGGTCGGSLVSNTYTTSTISGDCTVVANFAIDTHTVTSSVGTPAGSISPLGGQQIDHGSTTQFTLTPNTGYHIDSVGGTCGGSLVSNTYTTSAITADCTLVANFTIDTHTVTSSVGTPAGSISPLGGQQIDHGSTTQFTLTPNTGYHIDSVGGSCGGSLVSNTYTTSSITADCTVVANFTIDTFTLSYTAGSGGSISGTTPQTVDYGTDGTPVTAVPDANYHFVDWSDAGTNATRTDTNVMANISLTANFAIDTYTVTSSVGTASGSISPLGGQSVDSGTTMQFTLTPAPNYHIASVGGTCGGSLVSNTYTTSTISGDCTVVANFAIDTHTVTSSVGTPAGSISPLGGQSVDHGDTKQFTLTPDPNYHIASVGGTCGGSLVSNTYTTSAITADCTVIANFAIDSDTYTVTSSVGTASGSINPLGEQTVDSGTTTQFTLTPDPNFHIDSVGGTCGGALVSNTYTTSAITSDCTVVANFAVSTESIFTDGFE